MKEGPQRPFGMRDPEGLMLMGGSVLGLPSARHQKPKGLS